MENVILFGGQRSAENKRLFFTIWASVVEFDSYRNRVSFWGKTEWSDVIEMYSSFEEERIRKVFLL